MTGAQFEIRIDGTPRTYRSHLRDKFRSTEIPLVLVTVAQQTGDVAPLQSGGIAGNRQGRVRGSLEALEGLGGDGRVAIARKGGKEIEMAKKRKPKGTKPKTKGTR